MSPRETKFGLLVFVLLATAFAANMLAFQNAASVKARTDREQASLAAAQERASRLAQPGTSDPAVAGEASTTLAERSQVAYGSASGPATHPETVKAIQRELTLRGYEPGAADGVAGLATRAAIMAYEHDHGLEISAAADDRTLKQILLGVSLAPADRRGESDPQTSPGDIVRTVQQTLIALGYEVGDVDGILGAASVQAIRAFEADQRLPVTGRVSGRLIAALARATGRQALPRS